MHTIHLNITAIKAGWMFVSKTFQDGDPRCDECSHCDTSGQMPPYGEGFAHEAYNECKLGDKPSHRPTDCPAYAAHLELLAEHPTNTTVSQPKESIMKELTAAVLALFLLSDHANAQPTTVGLHIATAHSRSGFCNINPGVYGRWANGFTTGIYRNSECNTSAYAGWTWETEPIVPGVRAAITLGGVTGYAKAKVLPLVMPSLAVQINSSTAVRLGYIPKVEKRGAHALHLMLEHVGNFDGVGATK